jgi:hypothetical protein
MGGPGASKSITAVINFLGWYYLWPAILVPAFVFLFLLNPVTSLTQVEDDRTFITLALYALVMAMGIHIRAFWIPRIITIGSSLFILLSIAALVSAQTGLLSSQTVGLFINCFQVVFFSQRKVRYEFTR